MAGDYKEWDKYWNEDSTFKKVNKIDTAYDEVVNYVLSLAPKGAKIIELGCGSGNYAINFANAGYDTLATDYSQKALDLTEAKAQKLYGIKIKTQKVDIYSMPFSETFDIVFSDGVIEHLDLDKALQEIKKITKKNGFIISKVPSGNLLYNLSFKANSLFGWLDDEQHFSKETWKSIFERNGFIDVEVRMCGNPIIALRKRIIDAKWLDKVTPSFGKIYYLIKARKI